MRPDELYRLKIDHLVRGIWREFSAPYLIWLWAIWLRRLMHSTSKIAQAGMQISADLASLFPLRVRNSRSTSATFMLMRVLGDKAVELKVCAQTDQVADVAIGHLKLNFTKPMNEGADNCGSSAFSPLCER